MSAMTRDENGNGGPRCIPNNPDRQKANTNRSCNILQEKDFPPAITELAKECFAPGIKNHFEQKTNLPLLKSTNLAILKRQQSKSKGICGTQTDSHDLNGGPGRTRCSSFGPEFYDRNYMSIVRACWEIVLSFMGDENEVLEKGQCTGLFESTINQRRQVLAGKKKMWRKSTNADVAMKKKASNARPASMFVTSDHNENASPKKALADDHAALSRETLASMTVLEKVRFLANVGLKNPCFRDEIYCQVMKQLVCNPSVRSSALGWILLSVIVGCFSPSEKILVYTEAFLKHQRTAYSAYCLEKLTRTLLNGDRKNPPCSLELQAAKARQLIRVPIICMDYSVRTIWADSATTTEEICEKMASKNRLGDSFGFSLYLSLDKKLVSLGSGSFPIMDGISQAEHYSKQNNVHEVWKIYYRREFFTLLDATGVGNNQMKTWLTYSQICGGVQSGEYQCTKPQDLALLMAHQYCVRHGLNKISMKWIVAVCDQNLPAAVYTEGKKKKWCQMVYTTLKALEAKTRRGGKIEALDVMNQVVRFGSRAFIDNFTKSFFLSSYRAISDNGHFIVDVMIKINHSSVVICRNGAFLRINEASNDDNVLVEINTRDLKAIEVKKSSEDETAEIRVTLHNAKIYAMGSPQVKEIARILDQYISEVAAIRSSESSA